MTSSRNPFTSVGNGYAAAVACLTLFAATNCDSSSGNIAEASDAGFDGAAGDAGDDGRAGANPGAGASDGQGNGGGGSPSREAGSGGAAGATMNGGTAGTMVNGGTAGDGPGTGGTPNTGAGGDGLGGNPSGGAGNAATGGEAGDAPDGQGGSAGGPAGGAPSTTDFPCGGPGQPCCPVDGCLDGGCCSGSPWYRCTPPGQVCGIGVDDVCVDGSCGDCGGLGQVCCGQHCSAPGSVCRFADGAAEGECVACGGDGEACCRGGACNDGLGCDESEPTPLCTAECGSPGEVCCGGSRCNGDACCAEGECIAPGEPCAAWANGASVSGGMCAGGNCADCGGVGQPCCLGSSLFCSEAGAICPVDGNNINLECSLCGGAGQPCCPGDVCFDDGCCLGVGDALASICFAEGEACNNQGGTCDAGRCTDCGRPGQRCCSFDRCYESACGAQDCQ